MIIPDVSLVRPKQHYSTFVPDFIIQYLYIFQFIYIFRYIMENLLIARDANPYPKAAAPDIEEIYNEETYGCESVKRFINANVYDIPEGLTCQKHHKVTYNYPALELLKPNETCVLAASYKYNKRLDPLSSGVDAPIGGHYNIFSTKYGDLAIRHLAAKCDCPPCKNLAIGFRGRPHQMLKVPNENLISVIKTISPFQGSTVLDFVTYQTTDGKRGVRVRRATQFDTIMVAHRVTGSVSVKNADVYDYSEETWNSFFNHESLTTNKIQHPNWLHTIAVLMLRADDHAYLEVKKQIEARPQLAHLVQESVSIDWYYYKAPNPFAANTDGFLLAPVSVLSREVEDRSCIICTNKYKTKFLSPVNRIKGFIKSDGGTGSSNGGDTENNDDDRAPVATICGHVTCKACICAMYEENVLEDEIDLCCPICREKLLGDLIPYKFNGL